MSTKKKIMMIKACIEICRRKLDNCAPYERVLLLQQISKLKGVLDEYK